MILKEKVVTVSGVGKMIKIFSAIFFSVVFLLSATTYAKVVEFEASGSYRMGENDTMIQAKGRRKKQRKLQSATSWEKPAFLLCPTQQ